MIFYTVKDFVNLSKLPPTSPSESMDCGIASTVFDLIHRIRLSKLAEISIGYYVACSLRSCSCTLWTNWQVQVELQI